MAIPLWVGHYIGLPFKVRGRKIDGLDCWGLVRLVIAEQAGVLLPAFEKNYDGISTKLDAEKIGAHIRSTAGNTDCWDPIAPGQEKIFNVIVLRMRGQPMHVGIVIDDGLMLHIEHGANSCIEKYHGMRWKDLIYGFYRHVSI